MSKCEHKNFSASVSVNRLEDVGRFCADVSIKCDDCGQPFRFLGLPLGLDLNGATVSFDGCEAHLAIAAKGETIPPINGVEGFIIRRAEAV